MHNPSLDFAASDTHTGYRLRRFELYNWGTFHQRVWHLAPQGENALLTGDIGAGKSTLVDGLTTLLVAPQRVVYNKAAGAESRERSLMSYVRGHYKSAKGDDRLSAKAVALRDQSSYSVLLATFHNQGYDQTVTLAQVFWTREGKSQPERFHLLSEHALTIASDFADFGDDVLALKRRLRDTSGTQLFDSFSRYAGAYRRRLGINNDKAIDLFYQTVSMKSVGNLTEFVRSHMLETSQVQQRVDDICRDFDNLNRAHEAVLKAKRQIELLSPLTQDCRRHTKVETEIGALTQCRGALYGFFAAQKIALLDTRIETRSRDLVRGEDRIHALEVRLRDLRQGQVKLQSSIDASGGRRLQELAHEISRLDEERIRKQTSADAYRAHCESLAFAHETDSAGFYGNREQAERRLAKIESERETIEEQRTDAQLALRELNRRYDEIGKEIDSLEARQSNIPSGNLRVREQLCATLMIDEELVPFVGELVQVRERESRWEGAAERLLHNFALSLLVPDDLYSQVSQYVDKTHLRGRLVYYRVREQAVGQRPVERGPRYLWCKLEIKADISFQWWLQAELARRFDHYCCEDLTEFHRLPKAITAPGQIKGGGERHEKDDRHRIDDRSRFVLGWSNESKIAALRLQQQTLASEGEQQLAIVKQLASALEKLRTTRDHLRDLLQIERFSDIEWQPIAETISQLKREQRSIEDSSDTLQTLRGQLELLLRRIEDHESKREKLRDAVAERRTRLRHDEELRSDALAILATITPMDRETLFPSIAAMQIEAVPERTLTVENCDSTGSQVREWLQAKIDSKVERKSTLASRIVRQMQIYKTEYPLETTEVDASVESAVEFGQMLHRLEAEDLPRHEQRFKTLLKEETIHHIALFQNQLDKETRDIDDKIKAINHSLEQIDYNPGTLIRLGMDRSADAEVRQFQQDLRACLGDSLGGSDDEVYTERKYLQVKALIERFEGREGYTDLDQRWTRKVTDVRNWYEFSVSERWREDDVEREFYNDSAGKSGGQKEKLAYTILASALAYQFGLKMGETRSRSFRFVMIDEAFGRGSDESARYGLELFKKLNLQLLIVTPLQKIHVIEPYVRSVHYVSSNDGMVSRLRNLSIEEFQTQRSQHQQREEMPTVVRQRGVILEDSAVVGEDAAH